MNAFFIFVVISLLPIRTFTQEATLTPTPVTYSDVMIIELPNFSDSDLVETNGFQNMRQFCYIEELLSVGDAALKLIIVGGSYNTPNLDIPITAVVQSGDVGTKSTVVVDDLNISM